MPQRFQSQLLLKIHIKCSSALCCIGLILCSLVNTFKGVFYGLHKEIKINKTNGHVFLLPVLSSSLIIYLLAVSFPSGIFSLIYLGLKTFLKLFIRFLILCVWNCMLLSLIKCFKKHYIVQKAISISTEVRLLQGIQLSNTEKLVCRSDQY